MLTETVELVEPGELGIQRDEPAAAVPSGPDAGAAAPSLPQTAPSSGANAKAQLPAAPDAHSIGNGSVSAASAEIVQPAEDEGSRLRQRLKAAVKGATSHP